MALTYASAIAQIVTHATAAGAAVTPPILDVAIGAPRPGSTRSVRAFYGGEIASPKMGEGSLTSRFFGEQVHVVLWIALTNLSQQEIDAVETEIYTFKDELRTRILGDSQLGGAVADLVMGFFESDFVVVGGGARYRELGVTLTLDYSEYTLTA